MSEYKEGVKFAVIVRQKFVRWCGFLLVDLPPQLATNLELRKCQAIEELDANVKKMLEVRRNLVTGAFLIYALEECFGVYRFKRSS